MKYFKTGMTVLISIFLFIIGSSFILAQQNPSQNTQKEEIILTTYYPCPYGSYDKFQANKVSIGDTNGDGQQTYLDLEVENEPITDGQIYLAKGAIFKPQKTEVKDWFAGKRGELRYSESADSFYYFNGSQWVAQGGNANVAVTMYGSNQCPEGWETMYTGIAVSTGLNSFNTGGAGGGGIVCRVGADPFPYSDFGIHFMWMTGYHTYSPDSLPCAVCVK